MPNVVSVTGRYLTRMRHDPEKWKILYLDALVFSCFAYSTLDIMVDWEGSLQCKKNVGCWLLGSYAMISLFRILRYIGQAHCNEGDENKVLHVRQPVRICRYLAWFTWIFLVPAFLCWTAMGSYRVIPLLWQGQNAENECLPTGRSEHIFMRLLLCYGWGIMSLMHLCGVLRFEWRLRRAEAPCAKSRMQSL